MGSRRRVNRRCAWLVGRPTLDSVEGDVFFSKRKFPARLASMSDVRRKLVGGGKCIEVVHILPLGEFKPHAIKRGVSLWKTGRQRLQDAAREVIGPEHDSDAVTGAKVLRALAAECDRVLALDAEWRGGVAGGELRGDLGGRAIAQPIGTLRHKDHLDGKHLHLGSPGVSHAVRLVQPPQCHALPVVRTAAGRRPKGENAGPFRAVIRQPHVELRRRGCDMVRRLRRERRVRPSVGTSLAELGEDPCRVPTLQIQRSLAPVCLLGHLPCRPPRMIPRKVKRDGALPGRTRGLPDVCDANRVGLAGAAEAGGGGVGRPCAVFKRQQQAQGNRKGGEPSRWAPGHFIGLVHSHIF